MKTKCRILFILIGLAISNAYGVGLTNGNFELPVEPGEGAGGLSVAPSGFGWTIASGDIDLLTSAYWQPSSGSQSIDLNGGTIGSIYQDFTFSNAGTWTIKFDMSANPDQFNRGDGLASGFRSLRVDFGIPGLMTNLGTFSLDSAPRTIANMMWVTFTTPQVVVSDPTVYRLQFTSLTGGAGGPALDNIRIQTVPEPVIQALFCSGLMGCLLFHRHLRRSQTAVVKNT